MNLGPQMAKEKTILPTKRNSHRIRKHDIMIKQNLAFSCFKIPHFMKVGVLVAEENDNRQTDRQADNSHVL